MLPFQSAVQDFQITRKWGEAGVKIWEAGIGVGGDKLPCIEIVPGIAAYTQQSFIGLCQSQFLGPPRRQWLLISATENQISISLSSTEHVCRRTAVRKSVEADVRVVPTSIEL